MFFSNRKVIILNDILQLWTYVIDLDYGNYLNGPLFANIYLILTENKSIWRAVRVPYQQKYILLNGTLENETV